MAKRQNDPKPPAVSPRASTTISADNKRMRTLAWLHLFRIANIGTAISNVLMGYLVVATTWYPPPSVALAVLASCLLYSAGMVLNDVFDYRRDQQQRPNRPLPSQQISLRAARRCGFGMLIAGVAIAFVPLVPLSTGLVAMMLAISILLYDAWFKQTLAGPWIMGVCRALNVLLGMTSAGLQLPQVATGQVDAPVLSGVHVLIFCGMGVYVAGITLFAKTETRDSRADQLMLGFGAMLTGALMLGYGSIRLVVAHQNVSSNLRILLPLLLLLVLLPVCRRVIDGISNRRPASVQRAVGIGLTTIIMIDAVVCLAAQPADSRYAIAVAVLLVPTLIIRQWVRQT